MSAQKLNTVSTKWQQTEELTQRDPGRRSTSLSAHVNLAWLKRAHARTRKDGAAGIDGLMAQNDEQDLEENVGRPREVGQSGGYDAPLVKRV